MGFIKSHSMQPHSHPDDVNAHCDVSGHFSQLVVSVVDSEVLL